MKFRSEASSNIESSQAEVKETRSSRQVEIPPSISIKQFSELLGVSPVEIIKMLMRRGVMANINQVVDFNTASAVASEMGIKVKPPVKEKAREKALPATPSIRVKTDVSEAEAASLQSRPPIVTIMGHVDHGKTSLLDVIRQTNVTATEAGGITQHIGAYQVEVDKKKITFLDTPGHEAFTAMRARGAKATDIAILVVAADDGVMPQTIEAINHARAADVPIIVALNKIDKPDANPDKVKQQLSEHGLVLEEWGGDVIYVPVSAKKKTGISELLENILTVADLLELKANPSKPATGVVIEAGMEKGMGPAATVLIQNGTLTVGDVVTVDTVLGKVKAMFNDRGKRVKKAEPSTPVKILGLSGIPGAGDALNTYRDEKEARAAIEKHKAQQEDESVKAARTLNLEKLYSQIQLGEVKELKVILKTDVQGSIDPINESIEKLSNDQVKVRVIHAAAGSITENDVLLALASKCIIVGFNSRPEPGAKKAAEMEGVDIRTYSIIYNLIDDVQKALKGMLTPVLVEVIDGHAEARAVFPVSKIGKIAGTFVLDGVINRSSQIRVIRQKQKIAETRVASLKRFKEDVKEVATGFECGIGLEGFTDIQVGDVLESYHIEKSSSQ